MTDERVVVVGTSMTEFGERDAWINDLLAQAAVDCLADADVSPDELDHVHVSNMASGEFEGTTGIANALVSEIGAHGAYAHRVDGTSASGGAGVQSAYRSVASGASDATLLVGGEKMTHLPTSRTTDIISSLTHPVEYKHGVTLPSFAGLAARLYLEKHDAPRESLARVAVKNHRNALDNPMAQFRKEVTAEDVLDSPIVADPLRLYDFCPITDGSAALLLCPEDAARERFGFFDDEYTVVSGVGGSTDTHAVHEREDPTRITAAVESSREAYSQAGVTPDDVDVAELHDMFSILEFLQSEDLGFFDRGEGWRAAEEGRTERDAEVPVNTSGGLKARGHPLGATGVAQLHELHAQLLDDAGERQVDEADVGVACNLAGFGNCVTTTVLEVAR
ncbi:MAG: thiolase family protein [Halobacteria archaeon]|nr:thiolase family protein [Halobacteria archaeon]